MVTARRTPSSGRPHGGSYGRIPAIDRAPEPRPSPSSTVSAWSSSVWATSTGAPSRAAVQRGVAGGPRRGLRAARRSRPRPKAPARQRIPVQALGPVRWPPRRPSRLAGRGRRSTPWWVATAAATAVSARESAPPDSATHHRLVGSGRWARGESATALRSVATEPCRSIAAVRRLPLAAAGFRDSSRPC